MRKKNKSAWHYIKRYKFNSLLIRNFGYVMLFVMLPLMLVVWIGYTQFNEEMNDRMMDMNEELLQKSVVVTDNVMQGIVDLLEQMAEQKDILDAIEYQHTDITYYNSVLKVTNLIKEYTQLNQYIKATYIYSNVNGQIITGETVRQAKQYTDKGKWYYIYKSVPMESQYVLVNNEHSILFCKPVFSGAGEGIGVIVFDVDLQKIRELLESENISQNGIFFVVDISGQVMYCNQSNYFSLDEKERSEYKDAIGQVKPGDTKYSAENDPQFISVMESIHKSWRYALVTEQPKYKEEVRVLKTFLVSSLLTGVLTSILAAYVITFITYRPVKKILSVIEKPQMYGKDKEATKQSNELLYITSNILNTLNSKKQMNEELEKRMDSLHRAQSLALQFQIDPHFLYNTLETIKWSAIEEMGMGNKTSKLITKVAKLYRIGLEANNAILTLREELDFLKLYVDVLNARFGEKIQFEWEIDESLYDCSVIKMCVQPLVENAVNHGLKPGGYYGTIRICAYQEDGKLCISVEDDGEGISAAKIQELNQKLQARRGFEESRVGLHNVNERIKLIYGNEYGVTLSSEKEDDKTGTKAVITFPYK
ncbi:MAG: sensor histidine kinase [Lachnospiraceae bacterium]|nr:sensor histidine kinase [Lachnospiraceae bacterium]